MNSIIPSIRDKSIFSVGYNGKAKLSDNEKLFIIYLI